MLAPLGDAHDAVGDQGAGVLDRQLVLGRARQGHVHRDVPGSAAGLVASPDALGDVPHAAMPHVLQHGSLPRHHGIMMLKC
jgi:hypothetical protein